MKIKFTCNWCTDKSLYLRILSNYAIKPDYYDILTYNEDYNYLVIINDSTHLIKNKEKTIGLVMEPSWQSWNKDLHNICKLVLFHDKSLYNWPNVVEWTNCGFIHDIIYHEMFFDNLPSNMTNTILKKKDISFVCGITNNNQLGYKMRHDLLNILQSENIDVDVYGRNIEYNPSKNQFGSLKLKYTEWTNCGFIHDIIYHEMFFDNLPSNMTNTILKKKDISFVCGITNNNQLGYKMRHDLLNILQSENIDVDVYGRNIEYNPSKNQFGSLKLKYTALIDYKFSVCIENSFEMGYISEKLYDCFMCNTVPIYCGAPNIFDTFSDKNVIKVSNLEEVLNVIKKIKNKEIKYEDFNIEEAKLTYLTKLNLITQVLNVIKTYDI